MGPSYHKHCTASQKQLRYEECFTARTGENKERWKRCDNVVTTMVKAAKSKV
jgi:hypothetical protein